jgi:hypothetical protein
MTELRRHLQDDDPLVREPGLGREEVERMRRSVVTAAREEPRRVSMTALALVAGLSGVAAAAVWTVGETPRDRTTPATLAATQVATEAPLPRVEHRQLHFSTPGGTRVIWIFNSQFQER